MLLPGKCENWDSLKYKTFKYMAGIKCEESQPYIKLQLRFIAQTYTQECSQLKLSAKVVPEKDQ